MKILITGAFGFVGTNLSAYLAERGHELWALDVGGGSSKVLKCGSSKVEEVSRQDAKTQRGCYERCFNWDELNVIPWNEVEAVIHLAGKAHDTRNASDERSYFETNVGLTKKMLEAAVSRWQGQSAVEKTNHREHGDSEGNCRGQVATRKRNIFNQDAKVQRSGNDNIPVFQHSNIPTRRFIFFSSVKAVADRVEGVLTEEAVPNPQTPYGKSKLEAEREVLKCGSSKVRQLEEVTANSANFANGEKVGTLELANFRTYILRPCMIHGPGNKGNLNLLYGVVRKGIPWPLGAFENRRSFASIGNVCAVVEGLLTRDVASGVYQVADDEPLSTNDLIGLIARSLGRRARIWRLPEKLIRLVAQCGDMLRLPLNSERLKKLSESYVASNAKIKAALGWDTMPVKAADGMRKTLESFSRKGAKTPRNKI